MYLLDQYIIINCDVIKFEILNQTSFPDFLCTTFMQDSLIVGLIMNKEKTLRVQTNKFWSVLSHVKHSHVPSNHGNYNKKLSEQKIPVCKGR